MKLYEPCYRKVKNIIEFRCLSLASLFSQELSIGGSRVKRVRGSQQVAPFSSPQAKKNSLNRENIERRRMCLFVEGDQHRKKNLPLSLGVLLPRITRLCHGALHNFYKLETFINAGLGLVPYRKYV